MLKKNIMYTILPRHRFYLTPLGGLLIVWMIAGCTLLTSRWTDTQHVVDALHKRGLQVDRVTKEILAALTDLKATSISFSITNTPTSASSGSIIVFANEQQARLFSVADSYYRQYPESARYRVVRNRNAVLLVKEEIPADEAKPVLEAFQAIAP